MKLRTDEIASAIRDEISGYAGEIEIKVRTAIPLWHEMRTAIRAVVTGWLGRTPILIEEVEPELIGGIIIRVGDVEIDGSVLTRFEKLRARAMARGRLESYRGGNYVEDPPSA
jgi:F-type H+-transporting ATPase subunit delta